MINLPTFEEFINEAGIFRNWTKIQPYQAKAFMANYKKADKKNKIVSEKDYEDYKIFYGFKKGTKIAEWKYIEDEMKIYSDMNDSEIYKQSK